MPARTRRKRPRNEDFQGGNYDFQSGTSQTSIMTSLGLLAKELASLFMHMVLQVVYPTTEAYEQRGEKWQRFEGGFFGGGFDGNSSGPNGPGENPERSIEWAYKTLEVEKGCTLEEARASFKKLAKKWHPDRNNSSEESTTKMQEVNLAFEFVERHITNAGGEENGNAMSSGDESDSASEHEQHEKDKQKQKQKQKQKEAKKGGKKKHKNRGNRNTSMDSDDDDSEETKMHREFRRKLEEEKQYFREQKERMRRSNKKRGWKDPEKRKRSRAPGALAPGEDKAVDSLDVFDECTHPLAVAIKSGLSLVFADQVINITARGQSLLLDDDLNTPLHYAARYSKNSIIQMCINLAGDNWPTVILAKNKAGLTARDIAEAEMRFHNDEATKEGEVPSMPFQTDDEKAEREESTPQLRAYIAYRLRELQDQAVSELAERERKSQRKFDPMRTVYMLFVFTSSYFLLNFMAEEYVGWLTFFMCLIYAILPATLVSARLLLIVFTLVVMAPTLLYYLFLPLYWLYDWGWWSIFPLFGVWCFARVVYGFVTNAFVIMTNISAIIILQYIVWQEKATQFSLKCLSKVDITGWVSSYLHQHHRISNTLLEAYERVFEAVIFGVLLFLIDLVWRFLVYLGWIYSILIIVVVVIAVCYREGMKMEGNKNAVVNRPVGK